MTVSIKSAVQTLLLFILPSSGDSASLKPQAETKCACGIIPIDLLQYFQCKSNGFRADEGAVGGLFLYLPNPYGFSQGQERLKLNQD